MKQKIAVLVLGVIGIAGIPVAVALATNVNVGGGVWDYGSTVGGVHSNYYHRTVSHGSTACKNGSDCASNEAKKNTESRATKDKAIWEGSARVYWHKN
jgi:lactococcin 972 family bacteriocin